MPGPSVALPFRRFSGRSALGRAALGWGLVALGALPLAGCELKACPLILIEALDVTIEHGAGAGECRYSITVEEPDGVRSELNCETSSDTDDCFCRGGNQDGSYAVELHKVGNPRPLDTKVAVVEQQPGDCGLLEMQSLTFTVEPLSGAGGAGGSGGAGGAGP